MSRLAARASTAARGPDESNDGARRGDGEARAGPAVHAGTTTDASGLRRILANTLQLFLAWILPRFLTIGAVIVAARVLGAGRFGAYGTAAAFAVMLSIAATLGMQPLLIREMSRAPGNAAAWLRAAHIVKVGSIATMFVLLLTLGGPLLGYPGEVVRAALLLGIGCAIGAYAENLAAWFQSVERMEVWMQASACYGLVTGALGAFLVATTRSVVWFCAAPVVGQLASLGWLMLRAPRGMRLGSSAAGPAVPTLLRALVPFAAGFVALTAHSKVDVLILERWWPSAEVGIYTAAHKFIDIVQALAVVVAAAMYPRLSRAVRGNATNAVAASRLIELTLLAGVIGGGALWLARSAAVMTVFGDGYTTAVPVTALLALAVPALAVNIVAGYVLAAAGRMRDVAVLYAGALTVKVALNVALVPANGAMGTASAMAATEIALAVCMLAILRRRAGARFSARRVLALVPCFAAWAAASALRPPACGVIAAGAYTVVALTFIVISGALPRSDRALLLAAVRGGGGGGGGSGGGAP